MCCFELDLGFGEVVLDCLEVADCVVECVVFFCVGGGVFECCAFEFDAVCCDHDFFVIE